MGHLENPAGLIHRIRVHKSHDRSGSTHALVIQRSFDMFGHDEILAT
jgi:hypothetical protein